MKKLFLISTLFFIATLCLSSAFAQYEPSTQMGLPEGAIARLGKGNIQEIMYSPDGARLAVTTSIGVWIYDAQTGGELDLITGKHIDCSNTVVFSPDHERIVTTNWWDIKARLWNTQTGKPIKTLTGHKGQINAVDFSPDGKIIATASSDKTVRLWNARTGKPIKTLIGHTEDVYSVKFSPDSKTIATASSDKMIRLWSTRSGKSMHTFNEFWGPIAFSPDGKTLFGINSRNGTIQMWEATTGQPIDTFPSTLPARAVVSSIMYSADGITIATGHWDGTIRLWEPATGQLINTFKGHTDKVISLAYSPDGKTIATASWDDTMKWWDITTGKNIKTFTGYSGGSPSIVYSPDGKTIATDKGTEAQLWDTTTGKHLTTLKGHTDNIRGIAFSPDSNIIVTGSNDGTARLWNAHTGKNLKILTGETDTIYAPIYSPDGNTIITLSESKALSLWNAHTGKIIKTLSGDTHGVRWFKYSPTGNIIATRYNSTVRLLNAQTGETIEVLMGHTGRTYSATFSPDGNMIVTTCDNDTVQLWNVNTGKNIKTLNKDSSATAIVYLKGNPLAITVYWNKTIALWDIAKAQQLKTFYGDHREGAFESFTRPLFGWFKAKKARDFHRDRLRSIRCPSTGDTFATVRNNNTVQLWNINTGKRIEKLIKPLKDNPSDGNMWVEYSSDGKSLATTQIGNRGGTVRLWNAATGKLLKTLRGHTYCCNSFEFSPDSKTIATGHWDGTVILWDIPPR